MTTAEIEVSEEQGEHRFVMTAALAETVRQPREAANLHADGKVHPLDVRRANVGHVRVAADRFLLDADYRCRAVPRLCRHAVRRRAELLDELALIDIPAEGDRNHGAVRSEAVGRNLRASGDRTAKVHRERVGILKRATADVVRQDQFRFAIDADVRVAVTVIFTVAAKNPRLLFARCEAPKFIALNVGRFHVADAGLEERGAVLAGRQHKIAQRIPVKPGHAFCRPDAHAFQQETERERGLVEIDPH